MDFIRQKLFANKRYQAIDQIFFLFDESEQLYAYLVFHAKLYWLDLEE